MTARWDVLAIGNAAVDEILLLEHFPAADSKMPLSAVSRQGGGLAATAAVAAARLGARAAFCSLIGEDELSAYTLAELEREGVDTAPCLRDPRGLPYHAYILVDRAGQTRTILYEHGRVDPPPEHITPALIESCRVLLIDHHAPLAGPRAAALARERGIPVVADVESESIPTLPAFLDLPDHLILGATFARRLTGIDEPAGALRALLAQSHAPRACTAVTAGARGVWFAGAAGEIRYQPAYPVNVVDTTGCGDVFHGAYAAALARGEKIDQAVRLAAAAAALKATQPGGRAGIPDLPRVLRFLEAHERKPLGSA